MKIIYLTLAILFSVSVGLGQSSCVLPGAPKLFNLSLGDSPLQIKTTFGKAVKFKAKSKGDVTFFQNYITKPAPDILRGVRALYLRFLDGRLYQIEIFYEDRTDWPTLDAFTSDYAAVNNFSLANWQPLRDKAVIDCGQFNLVADKILNPRLVLTDEPGRTGAEALKKKGK